jgi:hypothetical protein
MPRLRAGRVTMLLSSWSTPRKAPLLVPPSFSHLLAEHARGALSLESLLARVSSIAQTDTSQLQQWIATVRTESAAGRISPSSAERVLATLTSADVRTKVAGESTIAQIPATLLRPIAQAKIETEPTETDPTETGATERKPLLEATQRKAHAEEDDATQRKVAATLVHAPDATIRSERVNETVARTLRTPAASMEARDAGDHTHIIAERLVKSLDGLDAPHRGPLQPGDVIKQRFVLEKLVGKGGMGLVFSALDRRKQEARDPNPRVALKVLNADFQRHPQSLIALQREARKAQTLAHPNVVTVFDFDRDGDAVYMTMELLKGRALEVLVREARGKGAPPDIALPIIRGIAEGLAYAHRKGIVHSDLKPGNIFVLEDGTPKILDFGIARAVPNSAATETPDDFDAGMLGAYTEAYATNEMVEGVDPHPADDMYSLGIIAYELLTGFHPYQRNSAPKARKLGIKPPPLKGLKLREARALERCLSFDRAQRPQDAAEFLKLFRGVTALQKTLIAATAILTVAAGFLSYQNYREAGPAIPFSQLPIAQQQEFSAEMQAGNEEWAFYQREGNATQLVSAAEKYAEAYKVHPRNRDAAEGLKKVADEWLRVAGEDLDKRRAVAESLLAQSDFYRRYSPILEASE